MAVTKVILRAPSFPNQDPTDDSFIGDYEHFKARTFELDRKLGAVLGRAFDDCLVTESIFKLLQIFGSLIQRNLIALELSDRMPILVTMLNQVDLQTINCYQTFYIFVFYIYFFAGDGREQNDLHQADAEASNVDQGVIGTVFMCHTFISHWLIRLLRENEGKY